MTYVIGYALFMNPEELERTVGKKQVKIARLKGYKRVFNLRPARWQIYPSAINEYKGIANVVPDDNYSINCVVFDVTDNELEMIKIRSKSYNTKKLNVSLVDDPNKKTIEAQLLIGKKMLHGEEIIDNDYLPIPEYLGKCLTAASAFGDEFYKEWLSTTFTGKGVSFTEYVDKL